MVTTVMGYPRRRATRRALTVLHEHVAACAGGRQSEKVALQWSAFVLACMAPTISRRS